LQISLTEKPAKAVKKENEVNEKRVANPMEKGLFIAQTF
jgi:hypothetical protein